MTSYLQQINSHPRDQYIQFYEEGHRYVVSDWLAGAGQPIPSVVNEHTSVTTWYKQYFTAFDADKIITKMRLGKNWQKSPYYGMTTKAIKNQWAEAGKEAREKGSELHRELELYYNLPVRPKQPTSFKETATREQFHAFIAKHSHLEPYRTEWIIFSDEALKICGSVDILFFDKKYKAADDGKLHLTMMDWKRSKKIRDFAWEYGHGVLSEVKDTNYYHYSLQLNIYRYIIEKYYTKGVQYKGKKYANGIKIDFLYLVVMHPLRKKYVKIMCPDYTDKIRLMHDERTRLLSKNKKM
jgi:hypothetical protein